MKEKYYLVTIEETLSRTVKVKAESLEDAERKVESSYRDCDIILDSEDYVDTEISAREVDDEDLSLYEELGKEIEEEYEDDFDDSDAWDDGSNLGCSDCPEDECTGHCMSCAYRPI